MKIIFCCISIPKQIWTNIFFGSLIFVEIIFIFIFSYFWIKNYISEAKDICSDFETIDKMNGIEFEDYIKDLYIKLGYNAYTTSNSHDYGADIIAIKNYEKICIQTKRYKQSKNVGVKAVQEVVGSLNYYKANKGIVITTSNFTKNAVQLSKSNNITLIDRKELQSMVLKTSQSSHPALIKFINFITDS